MKFLMVTKVNDPELPMAIAFTSVAAIYVRKDYTVVRLTCGYTVRVTNLAQDLLKELGEMVFPKDSSV